jgi:hypothetical protein
MDLNVRIEKGLPPLVEGAVSFETGATREQLADPSQIAYEHHGPEFSPLERGALPAFFEDLLLGRPMPLVFATPQIQDVDTLVAISLFLHRDLATHPAMPGFVYLTDFVHRLGLPALAHIDEDLARFFSALRTYLPDEGLSQRDLSNRIQHAVSWTRKYIHEGSVSLLGSAQVSSVQVLDQGTSGFVVAQCQGPLLDGWVELYRLGFLRGILVSSAQQNDRRHVLIARKSVYVLFDLKAAGRILNQMESAMGELPDWTVDPNGLWLKSPRDGTLILLQDTTQILIRI